jgi:PIN domain nuclease of toxin-antitoxin system
VSLLLDTHVWVWSQERPDELGPETTRLLTDPQVTLYVSTISTLEIARLVSIGAIELTDTLISWVTATLESLSCKTVEISHAIAAEAYALPPGLHKDPADRILAATARLEHLTLLTADGRILEYSHVETFDARR